MVFSIPLVIFCSLSPTYIVLILVQQVVISLADSQVHILVNDLLDLVDFVNDMVNFVILGNTDLVNYEVFHIYYFAIIHISVFSLVMDYNVIQVTPCTAIMIS